MVEAHLRVVGALANVWADSLEVLLGGDMQTALSTSGVDMITYLKRYILSFYTEVIPLQKLLDVVVIPFITLAHSSIQHRKLPDAPGASSEDKEMRRQLQHVTDNWLTYWLHVMLHPSDWGFSGNFQEQTLDLLVAKRAVVTDAMLELKVPEVRDFLRNSGYLLFGCLDFIWGGGWADWVVRSCITAGLTFFWSQIEAAWVLRDSLENMFYILFAVCLPPIRTVFLYSVSGVEIKLHSFRPSGQTSLLLYY